MRVALWMGGAYCAGYFNGALDKGHGFSPGWFVMSVITGIYFVLRGYDLEDK